MLRQYGICSDDPIRYGCRGGKLKHLAPISRVIDNNATIANKVNLSLWNVKSVCNKTDKVCDYVTDCEIHVLCLTEI